MFDDRLLKLRKSKGLTQEQVAKDLGMPKSTYSNYELDVREPSAMTLLKISAYYGVSLDYLCGNKIEDTKKSPPPQGDEEEEIVKKLQALNDDEIQDLETFVNYLLFRKGLL